VVEFKPRKDDPNAELDLEYNVTLAPKDPEQKVDGVNGHS
jgi:hypothetical protein